ncbi:MAG: ATP-binding protein [Alphaproteobacteria bacterium]
MNARVSLLVLAVLTLMTSVVGGVAFYVHVTESVVADERDDVERTARILAGQTSQHINGIRRFVITLAGLPQLREALLDGGTGSGEPQKRVEAVLDLYCANVTPAVCYLMDRKGQVVSSSNRGTPSSFVGKKYAFRPYFQEAVRGNVMVYPGLGVTSGERGVYYAAPVADGTGEVLGVAVIKAGIDLLEKGYRGLAGVIVLTDGNGIVFASNRPDWLYRSLRPMSPEVLALLRESRQYGDQALSSVDLKLLDANQVRMSDGAVFLTGGARLEIPDGWRISYFLDSRMVADESRQQGRLVLYGFGLLFALSGLAVVALFRIGSRDITHRQVVERALERRVELETLLAGISNDFVSGGGESLTLRIAHSLKILGQFTETDRVVLFVREPAGNRLILESEWSSGNVQSRLGTRLAYDESQIPWFSEQFRASKTVHVPDLNDLPPEAVREAALLRRLGVLSNLSVPLVLNGVFAGFIGFHAVSALRRWSPEDIRMLSTAAEILSLALERARTEQQLRKLSLAIEQSPVAVVITDVNGTIEYANAEFERSSGYTPAEAMGQKPSIQKSGLMPEGIYEDLWKTITAGEVWRGELQNRRKNGDLYWEAAVISPLIDTDGTVTHFIGIKEDITELRRVAKELERSNAELEQFCYAISHDLQQPLRMVTSYLGLLEKKYAANLDETAHEFIGYAVGGGQRMQRMIRDLLEYSRVNTRGDEMEPCDSGAALTGALAVLSVAIQDSGGMVTVTSMPMVTADCGQIERLFQNLIGNAIKYHAPDRPPRVTVSAEPSGSRWVFSVQDNGVGIDSKQFGRIFELFQRLHTHTDYEGTGVGLSLCRRIVEHHGGRIWVESEVGQGSTFYFTLPGSDFPAGGTS